MKTLVTESPEEAASFIRSGDIAAFPTETVYGLGGNAFSEEAVRKIFLAKGRPSDNPLIVHVASAEQIGRLSQSISEGARRLMDRFFPGPLTVIVRKRREVPDVLTAGLDTVGIRLPGHPVAHAFLEACGVPVAAPSANLSGKPSPTSWEAVLEDLDGRIPCLLRGGRTLVGIESTVVDCTGPSLTVLRAGAVTLEQLREVDPDVVLASAAGPGAARSPGTKHLHYSPRARVTIVRQAPETLHADAGFIGMNGPAEAKSPLIKICSSVEEYAHELFNFFRDCDAAGMREVICQRVPETGIGLALMDRIRRAADVHRSVEF